MEIRAFVVGLIVGILATVTMDIVVMMALRPGHSPVGGSDQANLKFSCYPVLAIGIIVITGRSGKGDQNMSLHIDETI